MKFIPLLGIFFTTMTALPGAVVNVTPAAEENAPPKGSQHFGDPTPATTALAELLKFGEGTLTFSRAVTYTIEERDKEKRAEDGSPYVTIEAARSEFRFKAGRYHSTDEALGESATRIFATPDGWIVIQRGKHLTMVAVGEVKSVAGYLPDRKEATPPVLPAGQPGK